MRIKHSGYHDVIFNPKKLKTIVSRTAKTVRRLKKKLKFDAIAFTGHSGAGVAYPVSAITGVPLILLRKYNEACHGQQIEGPDRNVKRYLILDDFIATGGTVKTIIKELKRNYSETKCVGALLYDPSAHDETEVKDGDGKKVPLYFVPKK